MVDSEAPTTIKIDNNNNIEKILLLHPIIYISILLNKMIYSLLKHKSLMTIFHRLTTQTTNITTEHQIENSGPHIDPLILTLTNHAWPVENQTEIFTLYSRTYIMAALKIVFSWTYLYHK